MERYSVYKNAWTSRDQFHSFSIPSIASHRLSMTYFQKWSRSKTDHRAIQLGLQEHASHRTRPTSSQFMHFRATNSAVKWFLCRLFLDPLQMRHGSRRKPPQIWHVLHASGLWNANTRISIIITIPAEISFMQNNPALDRSKHRSSPVTYQSRDRNKGANPHVTNDDP